MPEYGALIFSGVVIALIGFGLSLPFSFKNMGKGSLWISLLLGLGCYFLIPLIQPSLQNWALNLFPSDASLIFKNITLALLSGVLQEMIKFLFIFPFKFPSFKTLLSVGAMLGMGFGLGESFYILYSIRNLTYSMPAFVFFLDRASSLLLHISLGFILAYGLKRNRTLIFLPTAMLLHSGFAFLSLLHTDKKLSLWATVLTALGASLALLLFSVFLFQKDQREASVRLKKAASGN